MNERIDNDEKKETLDTLARAFNKALEECGAMDLYRSMCDLRFNFTEPKTPKEYGEYLQKKKTRKEAV